MRHESDSRGVSPPCGTLAVLFSNTRLALRWLMRDGMLVRQADDCEVGSSNAHEIVAAGDRPCLIKRLNLGVRARHAR